ncbi:MAG TPA: NUDIX domain-containing protein [Myxococcota bacterium]|nr:NUDIX domain-containing protein [Myxococcota bacterium]
MARQASPPALIVSAGMVLQWVAPAGGAPLYLLLRAYRNWDFPKGVVEPGETPMAAALRELHEETGLSRRLLSLPKPPVCLVTPPYATRHRGESAMKETRYFVARLVDAPPALQLSREHHEARWLPVDDARPLLIARLQDILARAHAWGQATPLP